MIPGSACNLHTAYLLKIYLSTRYEAQLPAVIKQQLAPLAAWSRTLAGRPLSPPPVRHTDADCEPPTPPRSPETWVARDLVGEFVDGEEEVAAMTPPAPVLGAPGPRRGISA